MANFFSSLFGSGAAGQITNAAGGLGPSFMTQGYVDPSKQAVANPLSTYLAGQVGQGLPSYGGQMVAPLPNGGGNAVAPLLNMTSQQLINQTNSAAENEFKNSFAANTLEQNAGGLSSSGAGSSANRSETALQLGLAQEDIGIETQLPQEQLQLAQGLADNQTQQDQAAYQSWWNSLAQNNPALGQAMNFLSNNTSSGTTLLSAVNPGILNSLIEAGGQAAAASGG